MAMNFCPLCGSPLQSVVPAGDDRERLQCAACARLYYVNPEVRVGCLLRAGGQRQPALVLARPEKGEKIQAAVLRALAPCGVLAPAEEDLALYATFTDVGSAHVFLVFRSPGETAAEAIRPADADAPWAAALLARFAADSAAGQFHVYTGQFDGATLHLRAVPTDRGAEA